MHYYLCKIIDIRTFIALKARLKTEGAHDFLLAELAPNIDDATFAVVLLPKLQEHTLTLDLAVKFLQDAKGINTFHRQILKDYLAGLPIKEYPLSRQVHHLLGQPTSLVLDVLRRMQYGLDVSRMDFVKECLSQAQSRNLPIAYKEALVTRRFLLWADHFVNNKLGLRKIGQLLTFVVFDTGTKELEIAGVKKWQITSLVAYKLKLGQPELEEFVWQDGSRETYKAFLAFIKDTVLVGQNVNYDRQMVDAALAEHGLPKLKNPYFCTYSFANTKLPSWNNTIEGLTNYLHIWHDPERPFHVTQNDAMYTLHIFLRELLCRPDKLLSINRHNKPIVFDYLHVAQARKANLVVQPEFDIFQENTIESIDAEDTYFRNFNDEVLVHNDLELVQPDYVGDVYYAHKFIREHVLKLTGYEYQFGLSSQILDKQRSLLVMDTGTGKTPIIFMSMILHWAKNPKAKILMITPTKILAHQHYSAGEGQHNTMSLKALLKPEYFEEVAFFTGDTPAEKRNSAAKVILTNAHVIASGYDTKEFYQALTMLVVDETHAAHGDHAMAVVIRQALKYNPQIIICAATATVNAEERLGLLQLIDSTEVIRADRSMINRPDIIKYSKGTKSPLTPEIYKNLQGIYQQLYVQLVKAYPLAENFIEPAPPLYFDGPYAQQIMHDLRVPFKAMTALRAQLGQSLTQLKGQSGKASAESRQRAFLAIKYMSAFGRFNYLVKAISCYGQYEAYRYLQELELLTQQRKQFEDIARSLIFLKDKQIHFQDQRYDLNLLGLSDKDLHNLYNLRRNINVARYAYAVADKDDYALLWEIPELTGLYTNLQKTYGHKLRKSGDALAINRAFALLRAEEHIAQKHYGYAYRELLKCLPYTDICDLTVLLPLLKVCLQKTKRQQELQLLEDIEKLQLPSGNGELKKYLDLFKGYTAEFRETLLDNGVINTQVELTTASKPQEIMEIIHTYPGVKTLIFCPTKHTVYKLLALLNAQNIPATEIVGKKGSLGQSEQVQFAHLKKFRDNECQIMVATEEMAGEGLDIPDLAITVMYSPTTSAKKSKQTNGRVRKPVLINGKEIAANIVLRTAGYEDMAFFIGGRRVRQMEQDNL